MAAQDAWDQTLAKVSSPVSQTPPQPTADPWGHTLARLNPTTAPQPVQSAPQPASADPWDTTLAKLSPNSAPTQNAVDSTPAENPFGQSQIQDDRLGEDLPWYSRPLLTHLGIGQYREGATGIEKGAEKFASGLLTPLNIGLMLATGGLGALAEGAGIAATTAAAPAVGEALAGSEVAGGLSGLAAKALSGLAPKTATTVMNAARTASQMATLGFTGQQIMDLGRTVPEVADAIKAGNTDRALELGTQALLQTVAVAASTKHLHTEVAEHGVWGNKLLSYDPESGPIWSHTKQIVGEHQKQQEIGQAIAKNFENQYKDIGRDRDTSMAVKLYVEAGGDHDVLAKQAESVDNAEGLKPALKTRYSYLLDRAQNLTDEQKALADDLKTKYAQHVEQLKAIDHFKDSEGKTNLGRENYAGQNEWVFDPEDEDSAFNKPTGKKYTKNPAFLKRRTFNNTIEGVLEGLEPKERGAVGDYGRYVRKLYDTLGIHAAEKYGLDLKGPDGRNIFIRPSDVRILDVDGEKVKAAKVGEAQPENAVDSTDPLAGAPGAGHPIVPLRDYSHVPELVEKSVADIKPGEYRHVPLSDDLSGKTFYHGTASGLGTIDAAEPAAGNPNSLYGPGLYLTDDPKVAEGYSKNRSVLRSRVTDPQELAEYFKPGRIVSGYGGKDKVVAFHPNEGGRWSVDVQRVDKAGNPVPGEPVRNHSTAPERGEFVKDLGVDPRKVLSAKIPGAKLLNLDAPLPAEVRELFNKYFENVSGQNSHALDTGLFPLKENTTGTEAYAAAKSALSEVGLYAHEGESSLEELADKLSKMGYDGLKHVGGNHVGDHPHNVVILLPDYAKGGTAFRNRAGGVQGTFDTKTEILTPEQAKAKGLIPSREKLAGAPGGENAGRTPEPETSGERAERTRPQPTGFEEYQKKARAEESAEAQPPKIKDLGNGFYEDDNGNRYQNIEDYREGPKVLSRNFVRNRFIAGGKGDTAPIAERGPVLVHPEFHKGVMTAFEDHSWWRDNPVTKALLTVSGKAKQTLLSASPFHLETLGLRGIGLGLSPDEVFRPGAIDPESGSFQRGARYGAQFYGEGEKDAFGAGRSEGLAGENGLLRKIPGIGQVVDASAKASDWMFNDWLPRLKASAYDKVEAQIREKNPSWSEAQVGTTAAKVVNATFGGVNWRQLGVDLNTQDALRLLLLAPDFTGSHFLLGKAAMEGGGSVVGQSLLRIGAYNMAAAQALNLLIGGKVRLDHPFGVVSPDDKKVYSIRTMPSDIYRALTDPRQFGFNRLNPLIARTGLEALTGRNDQGKVVTGQQQFLDLIRNVIPMSSQNLLGRAVPGLTRGQTPSWGEVAGRGAGLSISNDATEAEKLAAKYASSHAESGPVDSDKIAKHQAVLKLEDGVLKGETQWSEVQQMVEDGRLAPDDATAIKKAVETAKSKNIPPESMQLYTRVSRLPVREALETYDKGTNGEKELLLPLVERKAQAYYKKARKSMSPQERNSDETYKLLRVRMPHLDPW